jgi:DNA polymerase-4
VSRTILFAEVPQFYASVERCEDPELRGRPVLVGGDPRKRGLVQAASPDALAAGVTLDMTMLEALQVCPRARALRTDMPRYRALARRLLASLRQVLPSLEASGLGGAYFDLTGIPPAPEELARRLQERVAEEPGLPLRVGIASSRFLARLAAEEAGESGIRRIPEGEERAFLDPLPVSRLEGVGQKTATRLGELGARHIGDVVALGRERLEEVFGTHGLRIHALASGSDDAPVRAARHAQSLSREATVQGDRLDWAVVGEQLQRLARDLAEELQRQGLVAGRIALRLRFLDTGTATRSQALAMPLASAGEIQAAASRLLDRVESAGRPVRGVGIQLARLAPAAERDRQLELFRSGR